MTYEKSVYPKLKLYRPSCRPTHDIINIMINLCPIVITLKKGRKIPEGQSRDFSTLIFGSDYMRRCVLETKKIHVNIKQN